MTLGKKTSIDGKKKEMELRFVLSGFRAQKICQPSVLRVIGNGTDNEKHIAESQAGWRKKKRGGRGRKGDELGWNRSKFPS